MTMKKRTKKPVTAEFTPLLLGSVKPGDYRPGCEFSAELSFAIGHPDAVVYKVVP